MPLYRRRTETVEAVQLTATNAADVATFVGGSVLDDGSVALPSWGSIPIGYFAAADGSMWDPDQFAEMWIATASGPSLAVAFGSAGVTGQIAAGGTRDVVVTLSREMPTKSYQAAGGITSGSSTLLGTVLMQGIIERTTTTATVRVKNTGATVLTSPAITVSVIAVDSAE